MVIVCRSNQNLFLPFLFVVILLLLSLSLLSFLLFFLLLLLLLLPPPPPFSLSILSFLLFFLLFFFFLLLLLLQYNMSSKWCQENFLNYKGICNHKHSVPDNTTCTSSPSLSPGLSHAVKIREQLRKLLRRFGVKLVSCERKITDLSPRSAPIVSEG